MVHVGPKNRADSQHSQLDALQSIRVILDKIFAIIGKRYLFKELQF